MRHGTEPRRDRVPGPRRLAAVAAAALGAFGLLAALPASAPAGVASGAEPAASAAGKGKRARAVLRTERGIRRCANSRRKKRGLRPLTPHPGLARAARRHAQAMAKGGFFSHTDGRGRSPAQRIARVAGRRAFSATGENIGAGYRGARSACKAWMRSSGHRANILKPGYTHIGGGFSSGGRYGRYYVLDLGRTR